MSKYSTTQENIRISRLKEDCKTYTKKENFKPEIKSMIENLKDEVCQLEKNTQKVLNLVLILDRRWRAKNAPELSSKYLVHGIGAKLVSNWEQNMLYKKN